MLARPDLAMSLQAQRSARRLYMMLVASAEPLLRGKEELAIAPDGALWLLPFETLLAIEPNDRGQVPKGGYLIERWSVVYAVSAAAGVLPPPTDILGGVVALGDPLYARPAAPGGTSLPALPKSALELAVLDQQARGRERVALVGAEASRGRLLSEPLLADAGVIHLATHAVAADSDPARSGLWLAAEDETGPGHLRVAEIAELRLRARLVALTQCETPDAGEHAGRGVRSLAGAFHRAGVWQVMLSQWKPLDRSSGTLLDRFYRDYLRRGRTAPAALAEAKRQLIRKVETRSPFLWAPLVVIEGEGMGR
jgi:CHAT domain-containing protein